MEKYKNNPNVIILALPRGWVITAYEVYKRLNLKFDIVVPRKIWAPFNPEFAIWAITETWEGVFNNEAISLYWISKNYIDQEFTKEKLEAQRRLKVYRWNKSILNIKNKEVILIDDGIATWLTMRAAIISVKKKWVKKIIIGLERWKIKWFSFDLQLTNFIFFIRWK